MFWNKKDDKSQLPDLPPLSPEFGRFPEEKEFNNPIEKSESHILPTFPDSPNKKGMSQVAIKEAIESPEEKNVKEMDSEYLPSPPEAHITPYLPKEEKDTQTNIFVKIDRFNSARKALSAAQQKINEIDRMLKKIRETRMREEQELNAWEKEVENAKARIEEASKNLFEKFN